MTTVELYGELLTASEGMALEYNLLTYGEEGRTNKGKVTVDKGALEIPSGQMPVNDEHVPGVHVGYLTASDAGDHIQTRVQYYATPEGEKAYDDAVTGKRRGISVEVLKPIIRGGKLLAGRLVGAGIVKAPAFPSSLLLAADFGGEEAPSGSGEAAPAAELDAALDAAAAAVEAGDLAAAAEAIAQAKEKADEIPKEKENPEVTQPLTASAPPAPANTEGLLAAFAAAIGAPAPAPEPTPEEEEKLLATSTLTGFCDVIRAIDSGSLGNGDKLKAALATVTQEDVLDPAAQPAYLGELWNDTEYSERFTPLVTSKDLTSLTVRGWEWVEGMTPIADDWDPPYTQGDYDADPQVLSSMNDIPSRPIQAIAREWTAKRIAGGNRFDRAIIDFPVPGQLESYLREQTEYIKRRRDQRVKEHLISIAKPIVGTGTDIANAWRRIILGCQHVLEDTKPTYAILGNDIYRDLLGSDMLENLALLETSLGLESGSMAGFKIQPAPISETALNGRVIVGAAAVTVLHQSGGDAPIRVDAQELQKGAIDKAVFSYYLLRSNTVHVAGPPETNYAKYGVVEVTD
jgi:hypothetical protein